MSNKKKQNIKQTGKKGIIPEKTVKQDPIKDFKFTMEFPWLEKNAKYIVLLLTLVGLIMRTYHLGLLSLCLDEHMHVNIAMDFLAGHSLFTADNNGVFLSFMVAIFFKLFGVSEITARLPNAILGALTIPLIYYIGKRVFNRYIGLIAAFLLTFSIYSIYWAGICRNYTCFTFFYQILLIVFLLAFEPLKTNLSSKNLLEKIGLHKVFTFLIPVAFILAFLNHIFASFFLFSFMFYVSVVAIYKFIKKEPDRYTNKYAIFFYPSLLLFLLLFLPMFRGITRVIFGAILPANVMGWVMPDWSYIASKLADPEKKYISFNVYNNVLMNDFPKLLYVFAYLGLISSWFIRKKGGLFITSFFLIPFLMMSFVFLEPYLPRYVNYIYPIYLLSVSVFVYVILRYLLPYIISKKILINPSSVPVITVLAFLILFLLVPMKDITTAITKRQHGYMIKKELSDWYCTDWKTPLLKLKKMINKDDLVITTWLGVTKFYLQDKTKNVIWFRQMHYDTKQRKYVENEAPPSSRNAMCYDNFVSTVKNNQQGWFITDYYFYNVMTDPRARDYAIKNMDYYFNFTPGGDIQVFGWNHNQKREFTNSKLMELGRKPGDNYSEELSFSLPSLQQINPEGIKLVIDCEGVDCDDEAAIIINRQYSKPLARSSVKTDPNGRTMIPVTIDKSWLVKGTNSIIFGYNDKTEGDINQGFVVYNVFFGN